MGFERGVPAFADFGCAPGRLQSVHSFQLPFKRLAPGLQPAETLCDCLSTLWSGGCLATFRGVAWKMRP